MSEVLTEHFDYLSLEGREALYAEAIARVVRPGDVVADLGCGFGILGIQCLRAGAARVYGIDSSGAIDVARETVARAGLADRYTCIRGSTYRTRLPEKVDLVICDHVGWFGLDYDIIPMLEDARRRLLKPGGKILPQKLRLVLAGVSSDKCRAVAECWSTPPIPEAYRWLGEYQHNIKHSHEYEPQELCTAPITVGEIDFAVDNPDSFTFTADLVAQQDVQFDGIAGWFECELADGVWMTNSPLSGQRIARVQIFLAAREPFAVRKGEVVKVTLRCLKEGDLISWTITPPGGGAKQKLSTFNAIVPGERGLVDPTGGPLALSQMGELRRAVLGMIDGVRTAEGIEQAAIAAYPEIFPTEIQIRQFVRSELARNASSC